MKRLVLPFVVLLLAAVVYQMITSNPPEGRKFGQRPAPAVAVEMQGLKKTSYQVTIDSYGVTQPRVQTRLVSEVGGRILSISDGLLTGAFFSEGELLLTVDPRDFEVALAVAEASVAETQVLLEQEKAQAVIAERDWKARPGSERGKALALRKPQIAAAESQLKAAKARLISAKLDLERTRVRAPFSGRVLEKMVDVGQVINSSSVIADIYATDAIEVRLPIQNRDQEYIALPNEFFGRQALNDDRPVVTFYADIGTQTYQWRGEIVRTEAAIDTGTRQLYLIAQIDRPYQQTDIKRPSLKIGQFLRAKIQGELLNDVYVLPRRAVSQDNYLGVVLEGRLDKRVLTPIWSDNESIVVRVGLNEGERFSLTPINNVPAGTRVRSVKDLPSPSASSRAEVSAKKPSPAKES